MLGNYGKCKGTSNYLLFRDIQQKKRICAEKIETVTLFYSDLDNFTEVYNDSSPFEVCDRMMMMMMMMMMIQSMF